MNWVDEWKSVPVKDDSEAAEAECAGIISGMQGKPNPRTNRPWVVRRLVTKLWPLTAWAVCGGIKLFMEGKSIRLTLPDAFSDSVCEENLWHWLRGFFGSCGSLYLPKTSYYLTLRSFSDKLESTGLGWRRRGEAVELRNQEDIVTFLCNIGLTKTTLALEERAMMRGAKAVANRVINCDTANIRRAVAAASEQARLAARLKREGVLPSLPPALRELALARLANPEASLSEIGEKLSPPIRKSTVKYRWARLETFAKK